MVTEVYNEVYIDDSTVINEAYMVLWKIKRKAIEENNTELANEIKQAMITIAKIKQGKISY